jgi:hypothetical protein
MIQATLYSREDCHLCRQAQEDLEGLKAEFPHLLVVVDVDSSLALQRQYGFEVPVVEIARSCVKPWQTPNRASRRLKPYPLPRPAALGPLDPLIKPVLPGHARMAFPTGSANITWQCSTCWLPCTSSYPF